MRSLLFLCTLTLLALACARTAPRVVAPSTPPIAPLVVSDCPPLESAAQGAVDGTEAPEKVHGSMPKEDIRRTVRMNHGEVRQCYERALGRWGALAGRITIRFTIANPGTVCAAEVASSSIPDVELGNCIVRAVAGWRFPPVTGEGRVLVSYPFDFKEAKDRAAAQAESGNAQ